MPGAEDGVALPARKGRDIQARFSVRSLGLRSSGSADARTAALTESGRHRISSSARVMGWVGIIFSLLFFFAFSLVRNFPGLGVSDNTYTQFYDNGHGNSLVVLGLYVVPFTGIAFMWYMSATRILLNELGSAPSEITSWLQLAFGVVFICMMFAASACVGATALIAAFSTALLPSADVSRALSSSGYGLMFVYGVRAAGMFMIATTRLAATTHMTSRGLLIPSESASRQAEAGSPGTEPTEPGAAPEEVNPLDHTDRS